MRRTPLYEAHVRLGAKMVDFGGWAMPVSVPDRDPRRAPRDARRRSACSTSATWARCTSAAPRAAEAVQRLVTNDVGALDDGRAFYTVACLPSGGIVDDLIVYRLRRRPLPRGRQRLQRRQGRRLVPGARGADCDVDDASARDRPDRLPGPGGAARAAAADEHPARAAARASASPPTRRWRACRVWIARTGYTGEDGFEIFCDAQDAARAVGPAARGGRRGRRQAGRAGRARHAAARGAAAALRQRPRRRRRRRSRRGSAGW